MRPYAIAGIDPGATVGIAIIDLSGRKIATASGSGGMAEAVKIIERHGTPSLIACDVFPAPEMAHKVASYFSCRLFSPSREVREEEKRKMAAGSGVRNNHERDAWCAAVLAFRSHANRLRQIDSLEGFPQQEKEEVKHLLLKGYKLRDALLSLREPEEEKKIVAVTKTTQKQLSPDELRHRVAVLARENAHLRLMVGRIEDEKRRLESHVRLLENGVRQSLLRDSELRKLRFQLQRAAERLGPGQKRQKNPASQPRGKQERQNDALNKLGEPTLDLEKLVAEYRKGRK